MRLGLFFLLTLIPGVAGVVAFSYYALVDWGQLVLDYTAYQNAVKSSTDLVTLFKAESAQNIHRINLFAEGVWTLLSAILAAIGLHGWYSGARRS
jgi:hypothetical protein